MSIPIGSDKNNSFPELRGRTAIEWIRTSSEGQANTSPKGQRNVIRAFTNKYDIAIAGEVNRVASGSEAKNLEEMVQEVLELKRQGMIFDMVLIHDFSRLGRAGGDVHGHVVHTLAKNGIEVVSATQYMPKGPYANLFRQLSQFSDQMYADRIAFNTSRGTMQSILDGRSLPQKMPSYGTYWKYSTANGQVIGLYRRLRNGRRQLISPDSGEVVQEYLRKEDGFRKRKMDYVTVIPGDPDERGVVISMFEMRYIHKMEPSDIAKYLNEEHENRFIKPWEASAVDAITRAELYTGFCYVNRHKQNIYYDRGKDGPIMSTTWGTKTSGVRPKEYWHPIELPEMSDFLPEELRNIAKIEQERLCNQIASGFDRVPRSGNGRREHPLSNLITEIHTGEVMKGVQSGSKECTRRYYRLSDSKIREYLQSPNARVDRSSVSAGIPADFVEKKFYCHLETLLKSVRGFRDLIIEEIVKQEELRCKSTMDLSALIEERDRLQEKYELLSDRINRGNRERINKSLDATDKELDEVEIKINSVDEFPPLTTSQISKIADSICRDLGKMISKLASQSDAAIFAFIDSVLASATANLDERTIHFEYAVPAYLVDKAVVGLGGVFACKDLSQTHKWKPILLEKKAFQWPKRCSGDCWESYSFGRCEECFECNDCDSCEENDENCEDCTGQGQESGDPKDSGSDERDAAA